jgi:hypothetical protein
MKLEVSNHERRYARSRLSTPFDGHPGIPARHVLVVEPQGHATRGGSPYSGIVIGHEHANHSVLARGQKQLPVATTAQVQVGP